MLPRSVSEFPRGDSGLLQERPKVTLPLMILAVYRGSFWQNNRPSLLFLTDFTKHQTLYSSYKGPSLFKMGDDFIPSDEVLIVSIFNETTKRLLQELDKRDIKPSITSEDECIITEHGVLADVKLELKAYNGLIDGVARDFMIIDESSFKNVKCPDIFKSFTQRLKGRLPLDLYNSCAKRIPIENFEKSGVGKNQINGSPSSTTKRTFTGSTFMSQKKSRPVSELLFHQINQDDDTQRPIASYPVEDAQYTEFSTDMSDPIGSSDGEDTEQFLLKKITFGDLIQLQSGYIREHQEYEVDVCIVGIDPFQSFIRKTSDDIVKIPTITLFMVDPNSNNQPLLTRESSVTTKVKEGEGITGFLGCKVIDNRIDVSLIDQKISKLLSNSHTHISIKLQRRSIRNEYYIEEYWHCASTLDDLVKQMK